MLDETTMPSSRSATAAVRQLPSALWHGMASGLIVGMMAVVSSVSFAALVYGGLPGLNVGHGVFLALLASAINVAVVAGLASLPGTVGGIQSLPAAILASSAAAVGQASAASGRAFAHESVLATVMATTVLCALLTGVSLLLMGNFRAGRLVRFLPYPVIGGVIAGSGWLLAQGAVGIADGGQSLWHVLPSVIWALLMFAVHLRQPHPFATLATMILGVGVFWGVALMSGHTSADLMSHGWLLGSPGGRAAMPPLPWPTWAAIDWHAAASVAGNLATIPLVTAVALLLNAAGLESAVRQPVDFNRELRTAGVANLAGGLFGGFVGYQQLGLSAMTIRDGAASRWVGPWAALVCLAALVFGIDALEWVPRPVLGAQLLFLAFLMVHHWVLTSWGRLSAVDLAIVGLIVVVTALVGFLSAVLLGLVAAMLMFAVQYSRIDPVRQVLSGADYGSRIARAPWQRQRLRQLGGAVCALQLQGYMFFGIADRVLISAGGRLEDVESNPLRYLVLDFRRVSGCDSSAAQSFVRLQDLLLRHGAKLVVCHASSAVRSQLRAANLHDDDRSPHFDDLDHGLAWCEARLLDAADSEKMEKQEPGLGELIERSSNLPDGAQRLLAGLERIAFAAGETVVAQGTISNALYLLESGSFSAWREQPGAKPLRLQTMSGGGQVIGEVGFFLNEPRTASVVADEPSVLYRVTMSQLQELERQQPALAVALLRLVGELLAARVAHLVSVVDALER